MRVGLRMVEAISGLNFSLFIFFLKGDARRDCDSVLSIITLVIATFNAIFDNMPIVSMSPV